MRASKEKLFLKSPGSALWIRFLRFYRTTNRHLEEKVEELGLTLPQFHVLATLGYTGSLAFNEIGQKLMVTVGNLTGIVDRLEQKGLVIREREARDRRIVMVCLTDRGTKLYLSAVRLFEKTVLELFRPLNKSDRKALSRLLRLLTPRS
jgi:DNA-binding MarR family transcriptional regulator